jgi:hypothetical protein
MVATACTSGPPLEDFQITAFATSDEDRPLANVRVVTPEQELGVTGMDGSATIQIRAREGDRLLLGAVCPRDHRLLTPPRELVLRRVRSLAGDGAVRVQLRCAPLTRTAVIAVRAQGQRDLPVLVDGDPVTRLNESGVAHLVLSGITEQRFEVSLDTSSNEALQPQNPVRIVTISDRDDLVVYDQPFAVEAAPEPERARGRGRGTMTELPMLLEPTGGPHSGFHAGHFHD